jgi:hypothetical protein
VKVVNATIFLLLNLALAFYNVGTIWAVEVDIFRSWKFVGIDSFHRVQEVHWRKLPYWIFAPVGLAFGGSVVLVFDHPAGSPAWAIWGNLSCQALSHVLTALTWGRWQARLSEDPRGPESVYLAKILATHWLRTLLINAYAFILLAWVVELLRR